MSRLIVVIDARRAQQGAQDFAAAQGQMRDSARRTAADTAAANAKTIEATLAGLDREIARRKAVQQAQAGGVEAGRIEAKAQDVINGLRAKGINLTDQEIAQIREKTRASQELANVISKTIRDDANRQQAAAIAGAQNAMGSRPTAFDGPMQGPMTEAQHLEETRRKTEELSRSMNTLRGWVGDVGDMFDYAGKQLLGLNDAQAQGISTTIMATEKGMALLEMFGPQAAVIGGGIGLFLGLAAAQATVIRENEKLTRSIKEFWGIVAQKTQIEQAQKNLELLYSGSAKLTNQLGELSKVNISDVDKQMRDLMATMKVSSGADGSDFKIAADNAVLLRDIFVKATNDKINAIRAMGKNTRELSDIQGQAKAEETTSQSAALGRWNEASDAVKSARADVEAYEKQTSQLADSLQRERDILEQQAAADPSNLAKAKALADFKDKAAIKAQEHAKEGGILLRAEAAAIARATEMQQKYLAIVEKAPSAIRNWAKELSGVGAALESSIGGGALAKTIAVFTDPAFSDKLKVLTDKKDAAKKAAEAQTNAARDAVKSQAETIAAQTAILAAYKKGGEEAADIEAKYQAAIKKGMSPAQLAEARANAVAMVAIEKALADAKKDTADADKAKKDAQEAADKVAGNKADFLADIKRETEERKQLAQSVGQGSTEYEYQTRLIAALNKVREGGFTLTDAELADLKLRIKANQEYDAVISKGQTSIKEQAKASKEQSPIEAMIAQYDAATMAAKNFESIAVSGLNTFSATLTDALWGGKVEWGELYKSIGKDLTEMLIKMALAAGLKAVLSGVGGEGITGIISLLSGGVGKGFKLHSGGMVGPGAGSPMTVPAALFNHAPRFHGGLKADEFPAILQTGEEVRSRQQVAEDRRGNQGRTVNIHAYFPDVRDSRGFSRSLDQNTSRMKRMLEVES